MEFEVTDLEGFLEFLIVGERIREGDPVPLRWFEDDPPSPPPVSGAVSMDSYRTPDERAPLVIGCPIPIPTEPDLPSVSDHEANGEATRPVRNENRAHHTSAPQINQPPAYASPLEGIRLPIELGLCWRCGYPGHRRDICMGRRLLFCSRCGVIGKMSRDCLCPKETPQRATTMSDSQTSGKRSTKDAQTQTSLCRCKHET